MIYSYMKYTNVPSYRAAIAYGFRLVDEFDDVDNEIIRVYEINRTERKELK